MLGGLLATAMTVLPRWTIPLSAVAALAAVWLIADETFDSRTWLYSVQIVAMAVALLLVRRPVANRE